MSESRRWGLPGWLVVAVGTAAVIAAAVIEARRVGDIGQATDITLVVSTVVAAVVTRRGDLPLVVMFPPLAFVLAVLIAGQEFVDHAAPWKTAQTLMLMDHLGAGMPWVVGSTLLALVLVLVRTLVGYLMGRQRRRQAARA